MGVFLTSVFWQCYKCETDGCSAKGSSARAGLVISAAQNFFENYLFVTQSNYTYFMAEAEKEAKRKSTEFEIIINRSKILIANKEKSYEQTKSLILENPKLSGHYDLDKYRTEIDKIRKEYDQAIKQKGNIKSAIPTFAEYLKLLETTPVILNRIRDVKQWTPY